MNNQELIYMKQILGLEQDAIYEDTSKLRYGHIMIMTDQDYDEQAATIRRIIPLNTLWIWDRKFKDIYNWGVEQIR